MVTSTRALGSVAGAARSTATAVVTFRVADPLNPLIVAATVAVPTDTPVIAPDDEIVATAAPALIDHVGCAPPTTVPLASRATAIADVP